jgi:hypothetical protein
MPLRSGTKPNHNICAGFLFASQVAFPPQRPKVSAVVVLPMIAAVWPRANRAARQAHDEGGEGSRLCLATYSPTLNLSPCSEGLSIL